VNDAGDFPQIWQVLSRKNRSPFRLDPAATIAAIEATAPKLRGGQLRKITKEDRKADKRPTVHAAHLAADRLVLTWSSMLPDPELPDVLDAPVLDWQVAYGPAAADPANLLSDDVVSFDAIFLLDALRVFAVIGATVDVYFDEDALGTCMMVQRLGERIVQAHVLMPIRRD